jgi:histidyl-tRNA synthetase
MGRPKKTANQGSGHKIHSVGHVKDIVTEIDPLWNALFKRFLHTARTYGFSRVETPLVEDSRLYAQSLAPDSGLAKFVATDMEVAVRPSLLPGILRAYYQAKVAEQIPLSKWSYSGTVVRVDAKNQYISDYEYGLEVFGDFNHLTEAQCISAMWHMLKALGLEELVLEINSIGTTDCQATYQEVLRDFLKQKKFALCDSCNEHMGQRTLNVLRCANLECQTLLSEAPTVLDFLDADSHKHFTNILEALDELQIPYQLNPLYTGPEGSSRTNVSIKYKTKHQTILLGEAGYHDSLMEHIATKPMCCFGFLGSGSAVYKAMQAAQVTVKQDYKTEVFLVPLGELASKKSLRLFRDLTEASVAVYDHFGHVGVKNQLKQAEAYKSPIALIMGQKEALDELVILRDVKSGMQELFSYDKIVEEVKKRLGK